MTLLEKPPLYRTSSRHSITHVNVSVGLGYRDLVNAFERTLGRWDPAVGDALAQAGASWAEVEAKVAEAAKPFGIVRMVKVDQGRLTSLSGKVKRCSLYFVGNPVIANQIITFLTSGYTLTMHNEGYQTEVPCFQLYSSS